MVGTGKSTLEQILCRWGLPFATDLVMAAERRVTSSIVIVLDTGSNIEI